MANHHPLHTINVNDKTLSYRIPPQDLLTALTRIPSHNSQTSRTTTPLRPLHVPEPAGRYRTYPVLPRTPLQPSHLYRSSRIGLCIFRLVIHTGSYLATGKTEALVLTAGYGYLVLPAYGVPRHRPILAHPPAAEKTNFKPLSLQARTRYSPSSDVRINLFPTCVRIFPRTLLQPSCHTDLHGSTFAYFGWWFVLAPNSLGAPWKPHYYVRLALSLHNCPLPLKIRWCKQKCLDYVATQEEAFLTYNASDMKLAAHSDASYLSELKTRSRTGGHFFLSSDATAPHNNGAVLNITHIIKHVMTYATEAELDALYIMAREAVYLRTILEEMGHKQPSTPL